MACGCCRRAKSSRSETLRLNLRTDAPPESPCTCLKEAKKKSKPNCETALRHSLIFIRKSEDSVRGFKEQVFHTPASRQELAARSRVSSLPRCSTCDRGCPTPACPR